MSAVPLYRDTWPFPEVAAFDGWITTLARMKRFWGLTRCLHTHLRTTL